jgi:hypothetical protein
VGRNSASASQASESSGEKHCVELVLHGDFDLILGMGRMFSADWGEQDGNFSTPQNEWYATLECPSAEKLQRKPPGRMNLSLPGVTWLAQLSSHCRLAQAHHKLPYTIGCGAFGALVCLSLGLLCELPSRVAF